MANPAKKRIDAIADSPTTNDLLGFNRLVKPITQQILNATDENTPLTIGVYGEWGSGKTSFLQMVDKTLEENDVYPVWFNAWKYDQEDNLWSALIQTILDQTRVSGRWYRRIWVKLKIWRNNIDLSAGSFQIVKSLGFILLRILLLAFSALVVLGWASTEIQASLNQLFTNWFSNYPAFLAFLQSRVVQAIAAFLAVMATKPHDFVELFEPRLRIDFSKFRRKSSYRAHIAFLDEFSEEFKGIIKLAGGGKPVVVIIDDLDRCLPEKAIQVLEAIKLFLDVEGCIFLLAVDRDILEKAIAVKYKEMLAIAKSIDTKPNQLGALLGENYFEKIVQLPVTLPPLSISQIKDFVIKLYPDDDITLCSEIFAVGLPHNPRKVKRLLQTFLFIRDLASEEISKGVIKTPLLAKLIIMQNQFRRLYQEIADTPSLLDGLEKYFRSQEAGVSDGDEIEIEDPITREKVKTLAVEYPSIRQILLKNVSDEDSFIDVALDNYIFLLKPVVEVKPEIASTLQEDKSVVIGQYLQQVLAATQYINIRGIRTISPFPVNIKSVFIPMQFGDIQVAQDSNDTERVGLPSLLTKSARTIILGDPGSGKTTILAYLANAFATGLLQDSPQTHLGISKNLLPIFFPLRYYGNYIQKEDVPSPSPASFLDCLNDYFENLNIGLPSDFFVSYFETGNCILLLDGLDEIVDSNLRQYATMSLEMLARRYPTVRILVTSRIVGYRQYTLGESFAIHTLVDFDEKQISKFIYNFIKSMEIVASSEDGELDEERVKQSVASLSDVILSNRYLRELAANPLLLTIIVLVHRYRASLPQRRIELYSEFIDVLLSAWDKAKGLNVPSLDQFELRHLLAKLAISIFEEYPAGLVEESFIVAVFRNELETTLGLSKADTLNQVNLILQIAKERSGILVEKGQGLFGFAHLVFEEYLAAIALIEDKNYIDVILQRYTEPRWHEVIILASAHLSNMGRTRATEVIEALLKTDTPEGILLSGYCLFESIVVDLRIRENVSQSLFQLATGSNYSGDMQVEAKELLDKLPSSAKSSEKDELVPADR